MHIKSSATFFPSVKRFQKIYGELDEYLSIYVYDKIWSQLPENEKRYLRCFESDVCLTADIISHVPYDEKSCPVYRDRLIKRGLLSSIEYGKVGLSLPRFEIFIAKQSQ